MSKEQLLQDLQTTASKKQFTLTEPLAQQAIQQYPNEGFGYYYMALCNGQGWDFGAAQTNLNKALQFDAFNPDYYLLMATLQANSGNPDEAKIVYEYALKLAGDRADVLVAAGTFYCDNFENDLALELVNKAIAIDANYAEAYALRSRLNILDEKYDLALADMNKCLEIKPEHIEYLVQRVGILMEINDVEAVMAGFEQLIRLDPYNYGFVMDFATYLLAEKRYKEAESRLDLLIEYDSDSAFFFIQRATARFHQNKLDDAADDCNSAIMLDPANAEAYILLADIKLAMFDPEEAIEALTEAIDKDVLNVGDLYKKRGLIYMEQYDFNRAADDFNMMIESNVFTRADGFFLLGKAYQQLDDLDAAYNAWLQADENFHPEAAEMIETYCKEQAAREAAALEDSLTFQFEDTFAENANSAFIQAIRGKLWKFDQKATTQNNDVFSELPADVRSAVLDAFTKMVLVISDRGLLLLNPDQEDYRAYYRIDGEHGGRLTIAAQPLTGKVERIFRLRKNGANLCLDGFAEDVEFELQFAETTPAALGSKEKAAFQKRQNDGSLAFLGSSVELV